jgi:hypothetical protein
MFQTKSIKTNTPMKKNANFIVVTLIGVLLVALLLIVKCSQSDEKQQITASEAPEQVIQKPKVKKMIKGYKKDHVRVSQVPEETPTDEGFLVVDGTDSVEFCTDILSGRPYRIIIEGQRRLPLCQLLNEEGDSTDWDYSTQVLRFSNDSLFMARLMVGDQVFPFGVSEEIDSIPQQDYCDFSFAEIIKNSPDSIHSGSTKFPILGSATILFNTAAENADKLYLKVKQPGLINVTVVYDESVCGYPLFWDNDSIKFEDKDDSENQIEDKSHKKEIIAKN